MRASRPSTRSHQLGLRCICLFPAMQRYSLHDPRVDGDRAARREARRHRRVRALRGAVGRRPEEARTAKPLRRAPRQSARSSRAGGRPPRRAVHHSALRRRAFSRGAARRRSVPERVPRHLEHQPLDGLPPWSDARRRLPAGARGGRARAAAVRHRLVVFPARMEPGGLRRAGKRARRRGRRTRASAIEFSTGNFDRLFPA